MRKKTGDAVSVGDSIMTLYSDSEARLSDAAERIKSDLRYSDAPVAGGALIYSRIG